MSPAARRNRRLPVFPPFLPFRRRAFKILGCGEMSASSLSDLTPPDSRGRIVTSIRSHCRMPPHDELPPHRPPDRLLDAALGRRVAAAETPGAFRGGGG